jgi:hypothetical protein
MTKFFDYLVMIIGIVFIIVPQMIRKLLLEVINWIKEM